MDIIQVGERIKFLRELKGLNRNQLATKAGVLPTYIYQLEKGEKSPTVEYLGFICFALNISLSEFFRNNQENSPFDKIENLTEKQKKLLNDFLESF